MKLGPPDPKLYRRLTDWLDEDTLPAVTTLPGGGLYIVPYDVAPDAALANPETDGKERELAIVALLVVTGDRGRAANIEPD